MQKSNKNLNLLLSGQLVSQVGDKFYMLALSFMVLQTTGSSAKMGAVLAAALIPSLILGFVAGTFIDRYNRKIIIVGADFFRGVIISSIALLYYLDSLTFPLIIISQMLLSVNSAFFDPCVSAVIPQIVNNDELIKANSKSQFISGISTIIGPAAGGVLIAAFGYTPVFIVNAVSFLISAVFELFLRLPTNNHTQNKKNKFATELVQGYRYILTNRSLMVLLLMVGIIHFFVGYIEIFIPVIALAFKDNGPQTLGFLHTSFGLGTILITFSLSIKRLVFNESKTLFASIFAIGIIFISIGIAQMFFSKTIFVYLPLFIFLGGAIILAGVSFKTVIQKNVDNEFAGRVFSIASSIGNSSIPLAMIVAGFLLEIISLYNLLYVSGLVLLPLSLISYKIYKGS